MGTTLDYSPASWHIVANGANIDAEHRVTRERFSGTRAAFDILVKSKKSLGVDAVDSIIDNPRDEVLKVRATSAQGISFTDSSSPVFSGVDTSVDNAMSVAMQIVANTATAVLMKSRWIVTKKARS